jgi:hypothetical protein
VVLPPGGTGRARGSSAPTYPTRGSGAQRAAVLHEGAERTTKAVAGLVIFLLQILNSYSFFCVIHFMYLFHIAQSSTAFETRSVNTPYFWAYFSLNVNSNFSFSLFIFESLTQKYSQSGNPIL